MINGAHAIIFSKDAEKDRRFLQKVLGLPHVDVGGGWLIFGLPPSEVAVHPSEKNGTHELYFMCDDIVLFKKALARQRIASSKVEDMRWGLLCRVTLPGGSDIGVYEPRHARPKAPTTKGARVKTKTAAKKTTAKKTTAKTATKKTARRRR